MHAVPSIRLFQLNEYVHVRMWDSWLVVSAHVDPGCGKCFIPTHPYTLDKQHMYMSNFIGNRHKTVSELTL